MTSLKVFRQFNPKLIKKLPMKDVLFLAELNAKDLFSGDLKAQVQAKPTDAEAAGHFLDNKIEKDLINGSNDSFLCLLSVMEEYDKSLKVLATEIKEKLQDYDLPVVGGQLTSANVTATAQQMVVNMVHDNLSDMYKETRYKPVEAEWPPNQPKAIVSVALIHYKGKRTKQELFQIASRHKEGAPAIDKLVSNYQAPSAKRPRLDQSRITKDITDIFAPDPHTNELPTRILIEGAPGIGKTVLAKEIAYFWAKNQLLQDVTILFLLILRDPALQKVEDFKQFVQYVSMGSLTNQQIDTFISLVNNVKFGFVFDGFDEYPSSLQRRSYIVSIINGKAFPNSIVVITSRPTATISLHDLVDRRIDILGFAKEEREEYISQSLGEEKKEELDKYLRQKPTINALCFIPLHLAVLLYLFQQGSLPETLTEINESFIIHSIYRHLERHEQTPFGVVDKLDKVPEPIRDIVYKISKLAFEGLEEDKLVFTLDEIEQVCPNINDIPGAINAFGLLQAVQHYPQKGAGKTTSFNFLHYTMQEYLAAVYVSTRSGNEQLQLMEKTFWDGHFNFMWMMYVGIVGTKCKSLVSFMSKGEHFEQNTFRNRKRPQWPMEAMITREHNRFKVSGNILSDKRKCLHVFQCLMEAKSTSDTPEVISSMFKDGKVTLYDVKLLPHHISALTLFISSSPLEWKAIQLKDCFIDETGMSVLEQFISENIEMMPMIEHFDLRENVSSPWGVYCSVIRYCSSNRLSLCGGDGLEEYIDEVIESLQANAKLHSLTLHDIGINGIRSIETILHRNTSLQENVRLAELNLPYDKYGVKPGLKHQHLVQTNLKMGKCKMSIAVNVFWYGEDNSSSNLLELPDQEVEEYQISLLKFLCHCTTLHTLKIIHSRNNRARDDIITTISDRLQNNDTFLQHLIIKNNNISSDGVNKLALAIRVNTTLKALDLSKNELTDDEAKAISMSLKYNNCLQDLNVSWNCLTAQWLLRILNIIQCKCALKSLDFTYNNVTRLEFINIKHSIQNLLHTFPIRTSWNELTTDNDGRTTLKSMVCTLFNNSDGGSEDIEQYIWTLKEAISETKVKLLCNCIKEDNTSQELNMSGSNITCEIAVLLAEAIKVNTTLLKLDFSRNKLTYGGAAAIGDLLKNNNSLQQLNLSDSYITTEGAIIIFKSIKTNTTLQALNVSKNRISDYGAEALGEYLKNNNSLQELGMSGSNLTSKGAKIIFESIKTNTTLQMLNFSKNRISDDGAEALSNCLNFNCFCSFVSLVKLDVSWNWITSKGLVFLLQNVKNCSTIQVLNLTYNIVTKVGFKNVKHSIQNLLHKFPIHTSWNEVATDNNERPTLQSLICTLYNNSVDGSYDIEPHKWTHKETFSDTGIRILCDCIKEDNTTQKLNMSCNNITCERVKLLAEAIKANTTLLKLDLSRNVLSDGGAAAISDCLKNNNSLQELNISDNCITCVGASSIAEAIKENSTLHTLYIRQVNLSNDDDALLFNMNILNVVHCNSTLMKLELPCVFSATKVKTTVEKINKERTTRGISTLTCADLW